MSGTPVRFHPQTTFKETIIAQGSFYGKLRTLYSDIVLKTQLDQLRKQGSYDAFKLKWHPTYNIRRSEGARTRQDGIPPSLFWESDVGKWIEAACYFLASPDGASCEHAEEFDSCIQELVDMIEKAQQSDGYLNIYFTVVDPAGRFQNFRDMHEMYNAGHLLEASLAHHLYTGSKQFLNVMIKNVECFAQHIGPQSGQLRGYPGHPELELAILRLFEVTKEPRHLQFAEYLLSERGVTRSEFGDVPYFVYEARQRQDETFPGTMDSLFNVDYHQAHLPLHKQKDILGHSVRALYLTTAAADFGGQFLNDARRLWDDAVDHKMYVTGGLGTEPRWEGFHKAAYHLPQSTGEGGCYAETCASIACMMTSERLLSHQLDIKVRDTMELCLLNAVLGGGSLNGKQFAYANKLATWGEEVATRHDWFEVCCCPPNLSRTLGMLGGYTWTSRIEVERKVVELDIYLFVAAEKSILLPDGSTAKVEMRTDMPWNGVVTITTSSEKGWSWVVRVPKPRYAENFKLSLPSSRIEGSYEKVELGAASTVELTFDLPVRLLASHPLSTQDTLTISRGPIIYTAESVDNSALENVYVHFEGLGISPTTTFDESEIDIEGITVVGLSTKSGDVYALEECNSTEAYRPISKGTAIRNWKKLNSTLTLVPWFARANRGGAGHVRTAFLRAD